MYVIVLLDAIIILFEQTIVRRFKNKSSLSFDFKQMMRSSFRPSQKPPHCTYIYIYL